MEGDKGMANWRDEADDTHEISRAAEMLDASLSGPTEAYIGGANNPADFLECQRDTLRSSRIEPVFVIARAAEWALRYAPAQFEDRPYRMIALANNNRSWLLFDPDEQVFALAAGDVETALELLGSKGTDALAEWLY